MDAPFQWSIPERYNIGVDVCDRWAAAEPERLAILDLGADGPREISFGALKAMSDHLAGVLAARGVARGDRVAVLAPQRAETAAAHIAIYKRGAIAVPLASLFGPEALAHRLKDSGAVAAFVDAAGARALAALAAETPALAQILRLEPGDVGEDAFAARAAGSAQPAETAAEDPALIIYTSGTTGWPKGALHAHRVLLGHLPGVEVSHDLAPQPGDRFWTPADWAWIGGLLDVLLPALHHGLPVVAKRFEKFDAEAALRLMRDHGVRNAFLPPTALKLMRSVAEPERFGLRLRSVASGGEPLGPELIEWGRRAFGGATINEFYGQTECNMVVSSCAARFAPRAGCMGKAAPGHHVAALDAASGARLGLGEEGEIAVKAPDPVMFLGYWNNPAATAEKFIDGPEGRWLLTGDRGAMEADGFIRFIGRGDDVIGSAGYRIGPAEIEDCLIRHPAVRLAGVVAKPDALRGAVVAAYVTLNEDYAPSEALAAEIAAFVKARLAAHEYPRVVRFLEAMPTTVTGKIIRKELRRMAVAEAEAQAEEKAAKAEGGA